MCLVLNWCLSAVLQWLSPAVPPPASVEPARLACPSKPTANSVYINTWGVYCGVWGFFFAALLYLTAGARRVMASRVWWWKGACDWEPLQVCGVRSPWPCVSLLWSLCLALDSLQKPDGCGVDRFSCNFLFYHGVGNSLWIICHSLLTTLKWSRGRMLEPGR